MEAVHCTAENCPVTWQVFMGTEWKWAQPQGDTRNYRELSSHTASIQGGQSENVFGPSETHKMRPPRLLSQNTTAQKQWHGPEDRLRDGEAHSPEDWGTKKPMVLKTEEQEAHGQSGSHSVVCSRHPFWPQTSDPPVSSHGRSGQTVLWSLLWECS